MIRFKWTVKGLSRTYACIRSPPTPSSHPGCHITLSRVPNAHFLIQVPELLFPSIPLGEGNGNPLQYSCLENPRDRGAWWAAVYGVAKSRTRLSDFTFTFHFHALEKEMATHSGVLAWRVPGTGKPGGLLSMGSHRVGHDWHDLAAAVAAAFHWLDVA